jgi:lantibiotic biosynthesis protein
MEAFGMYAGRTGVAYALARHAILFADDECAATAESVLRAVEGIDCEGAYPDVIAGLAGSIPALLCIAGWLNRETASEAAIRFGGELIRSSRQWPVGWSWGPPPLSSRRDLPGLAHGASGCGYALLELFATFRDPVYRYAAEQAFLYERQFYDVTRRDWQDVRDPELADVLYSKDVSLEQLRRGVETGTLRREPEWRSSARWCHGASGIGLCRVRAFELLGTPIYRVEALAAVDTTLRHTDRQHVYGLCHGIFGNHGTLAAAAELFGLRELMNLVREKACSAIERFEQPDKQWPVFVPPHVRSPSLFEGEAGVGYHLLRLSDSSIPSILLPVAPGITSEGAILTSGLHQPAESLFIGGVAGLRRSYVSALFRRTLAIFRRLGIDTDLLLDGMDRVPLGDEVAALSEAIESICCSGANEHSELLRDAAALDVAYVNALREMKDFTHIYIEDLPPIANGISWRTKTEVVPVF